MCNYLIIYDLNGATLSHHLHEVLWYEEFKKEPYFPLQLYCAMIGRTVLMFEMCLL